MLVRTGASLSRFGTVTGITIGTIVVIFRVSIIRIAIRTIAVSIITVGISAAGTGSVVTIGGCAAWCGGRAAEPPRSAAPQATREAKANAGGGEDVRSDQKETGRAAG